MIQTQCDGCFRQYKVGDQFGGKRIRCKDCGKVFKVAAAGSPPQEDDFAEWTAPVRAPAPRAAAGRKSKARSAGSSSRGNPLVWWLVGGAGVIGLLVLLVCGSLAIPFVSGFRKAIDKARTPDVALGDPSQLFSVSDVPLPEFPPLGPPTGTLDPSGAQVHFVDFGSIPGNADGPGQRMKMRVYVPPGEHADHSLGCVLVAPAGSNLISGNEMDNDDYHVETLPYAEAGMVVVFYSIDGSLSNPDNPSNEELRGGYLKFRAARAGVVNGRNALDYALKTLPQVDPQRIYSAGHSSAAVLSLLLAAHEPRLRGCLAYAPATDVELRLQDVTQITGISLVLPAIEEFLQQSSPKTHAARINCPVFLFHARDDSNEPFQTTEAFAALLKTHGKTCEFSIAETGDHYNSMIDEGIPRGIEWMKTQSAVGP